MVKPPACALILLAAGAATRMGRPKQLLAVQGQPLLRYLVEKSLTAPVTPIIVILGAQAAVIRPCLDGLPVEIVEHAGWAEGMGSSLRTGIAALATCSPASTGVVIALADEPNLSADHITALIETHRRTGQPIVASAYGTIRRPPVFFAKKYFAALAALQGEAGASQLLRDYAPEVATVALTVVHDLDAPADYADYLKTHPPTA